VLGLVEGSTNLFPEVNVKSWMPFRETVAVPIIQQIKVKLNLQHGIVDAQVRDSRPSKIDLWDMRGCTRMGARNIDDNLIGVNSIHDA
jgi:hypothetical protein